ncbi:COG3618 Predicted metal-dependent hydrolase of the TIM-barrel fold [Burkholderiaceae bacterium]
MNTMLVDSHFHIFKKNESQPNSRYVIDYDASIEEWFTLTKPLGITNGVMIQPSFLGTDNSHLLQTIKRHPEAIRGIGVVEPSTSKNELLDFKKEGVAGIRLNLFKDRNPHHSIEKYAQVLDHLRDVGMHLEIHHSDGLLNDLLLKIPQGIEIVIDHFGRPKTNDEFLKNEGGIDKHREHIWVKLSAQYRSKHIDHHAVFQYWLTKIGRSRLLWGSDWPHTGYESSQSYSQQLSALIKLVNDQKLSQQILSENPSNLYWSSISKTLASARYEP